MNTIIKNQATINIGTLGHVSHGKSTLVHALTGIKPMKHSQEKKLSLTIKLGYANFKIYKCNTCPSPICFRQMPSDANLDSILPCSDILCDGNMHLTRHISYIDCPGHENLMGTMLSGSAMMDAAILVIAANQSVPQPQTSEHLIVADMLGITNMIILQNKVDLVSKEAAQKNYQEILEFVKGTVAEGKPIIPVSCIHQINLDIVMQYLCEYIKEPEYNIDKPPILDIVRSFDINKCGTQIDRIQGGVMGGTLKQGKLKIGQTIEIRPGIVIGKERRCVPLKTTVISLYSEKNSMQEAISGGLIAVGTLLDSFLTKNDKLQGQVIGLEGEMPETYFEIKVKYKLMRYLVGSDDTKIGKIKKDEVLRTNCGSLTTKALVKNIDKRIMILELEKPVCLLAGSSVSLSRQINKAWRLIGCGIIQ